LELPLLATVDPENYINEQRVLAAGIKTSSYARNSFLISSRSIQADFYFNECIVLGNEGVRSDDGYISNCFVFCDGDVHLARSYIRDSIIIATGTVRVDWGYVWGSIIEAQAVRNRGYSKDSIYLNQKGPGTDDSREDTLKQSDTSPLRVFKLCD